MQPKRSAFTLVELLSVVGCIVALLLVFSYVIVIAQEKARIAKCAMNLRSIHGGATAYAYDSQGWYPPYAGSNGWGKWYGTYNLPGPVDSVAANQGVRWVYAGLAELTTRGGGPYLSQWEVFMCPNQEKSAIRNSIKGFWELPKGPNPNTSTYNSTIGYFIYNGNATGWYDHDNYPAQFTDRTIGEYVGKPVLRVSPPYPANSVFNDGMATTTSGWSISGGSITPGNGNFGAGFISDSPNTIIMSDYAAFENTKTSPNFRELRLENASIFEMLETSHTSGMNTLYNDGRVGFMKFSSPKVDPTAIYFTTRNTGSGYIAQIAGPR